MDNHVKLRVAVVGSGMAGLTAAWLLKQDPQQRYEVEIFESGDEPSLDSASVSVVNPTTNQVERVDVPMRAFTEGYYHNLKAMYDYLGVKYHVQLFLFSFSRCASRDVDAVSPSPSDEKQYFVHASNNHRLPPVRPRSVSVFTYVGEVLVALICHVWFSVCCLLVSPQSDRGDGLCESFDDYLYRIKLPRYFVRYYLLPLMSAVTTCPHQVLLDFPADDVVGYKRCITSGRQMTVTAGVNEVQRKLVDGIRVRSASRVTAVEPQQNGIRICWQERRGQTGVGRTSHRKFDKVVLAVPPNVVGSIFAPLNKIMDDLPTIPVQTIVHRDSRGMDTMARSVRDGMRTSWFTSPDANQAHVIHLRTLRGTDACTEATHVQPSGVMVTSCPLARRDESQVISTSTFTRVLRTPQSRRRVNRIFGMADPYSDMDEKKLAWNNGDHGVFLVGSWCWDGMVLLEGCVVSALRTAAALGVEVPWKKHGRNITQPEYI